MYKKLLLLTLFIVITLIGCSQETLKSSLPDGVDETLYLESIDVMELIEDVMDNKLVLGDKNSRTVDFFVAKYEDAYHAKSLSEIDNEIYEHVIFIYMDYLKSILAEDSGDYDKKQEALKSYMININKLKDLLHYN